MPEKKAKKYRTANQLLDRQPNNNKRQKKTRKKLNQKQQKHLL